MRYVELGRTGMKVSKTSFGALPLQRVAAQEAQELLLAAYDGGINFFDTSRVYTDSEEKLGNAFKGIRHNVFIATKTMAKSGKELFADLETSLKMLRTDYIDVYQLHNPSYFPREGDENGVYDALVKAKEKGMVRFIGLTNHRFTIGQQLLKTRNFDTFQFPFSMLSGSEEEKLVADYEEAGIGFIAMKALAGGLIENPRAAFCYMQQHNAVPIWGIDAMEQLQFFLALQEDIPVFDEEMNRSIGRQKEELREGFCRGCGYCLPCPAEIEIYMAARMGFYVKRMPPYHAARPQMRELMAKADDCILCKDCESRCPYHLKPYELVKKHKAIYDAFLKEYDAQNCQS